MNTRQLAKALRQLADLLDGSPSTDLEHLRLGNRAQIPSDSHGIAVNLATLAELSRVDKAQWMGLVHEFGFPIEVRPRDASRDILGKLLTYLERDAAARERLRKKATATGQQGSPALLNALQSLLQDSP